MAAHLRVPGRMSINGAVATQSRATILTGPQVDPLVANLHALIAFMSLRLLDDGNGRYMRAAWV